MPSDQFHRIEKLVGNCEDWHEVGESGEPAFENSWVNYGSGFESAGFYKDPFGRVHLKGLVKTGTVGVAMFTLPSGYRPSATVLFSVHSNGAEGRVDINSSGAVIAVSPSNNAYVSLDGISFRV